MNDAENNDDKIGNKKSQREEKKYEHSKQADTFDATINKFLTWELDVMDDVSEVF